MRSSDPTRRRTRTDSVFRCRGFRSSLPGGTGSRGVAQVRPVRLPKVLAHTLVGLGGAGAILSSKADGR